MVCTCKFAMQELRSWLPAFVQLAHLPFDGTNEDSATQNYLVRSQPAPACLSTMEAVARSASLSIEPAVYSPRKKLCHWEHVKAGPK